MSTCQKRISIFPTAVLLTIFSTVAVASAKSSPSIKISDVNDSVSEAVSVSLARLPAERLNRLKHEASVEVSLTDGVKTVSRSLFHSTNSDGTAKTLLAFDNDSTNIGSGSLGGCYSNCYTNCHSNCHGDCGGNDI